MGWWNVAKSLKKRSNIYKSGAMLKFVKKKRKKRNLTCSVCQIYVLDIKNQNIVSGSYLGPFNWQVCKFSSKPGKILVLGPICPNLGFE